MCVSGESGVGEGEGEAVGGETDVGGKGGGDAGMGAYLVAHVGEDGTARGGTAHDFEGLAESEMRGMRFVAQGVDNKNIEAFESLQ